MNPEINSALNKVKQVLNHYRAFQEVEAALKVAADSERMVVEYNLQAEALRKDIAQLDSKKAGIAEEAAVAAQDAVATHEAVMESLGKVEASKRAEIKEAEAALDVLRAKYADLNKAFDERAELAAARIKQLESEADAAALRLANIEAKIAELKRI